MKLCRICFCCKHCTSVVMLCCFDLFVIQTSIAQIYNAPGLEIYRFFPCYVHFHLNFCSYMFFLCTLCVCRFALSAIPGSAPALLLAAIFRGRARRARAPIAIVCLLLLLLLLYSSHESMAALWREHGKMMKFGTLIGMVINSDLTNFGVSRTTSIAPPPVQKFNIQIIKLMNP